MSEERKIAKAEAAGDRARIKALRPWYKKKRILLPISFLVFVVFTSVVNSEPEDLPLNSTSPSSTSIESPTAEKEVPIESASQVNARKKAQEYINYSAFSKKSLIKQLEFEGFNAEDAKYGVEALGVDWNEQAALKAKEYLDYSSFSRSGLVKQLKFEGFTSTQAEYGVDQTGL